VRELRNEMQRTFALAAGGELRPELLSPALPAVATTVGGDGPVGFELAAVERWAIQRALAQSGGNKAEAARLLGIGRRTLYDKLADGSGKAAPPAG
jgi:two-component system NtrC family response regulator